MNQDVQARPCWTLLANKAQEKSELIKQEMVQAKLRLQQLLSSQERLQVMYEEYRVQLNCPGSQSQGMRSSMSQRQFMSQLLTLLERVATDLGYTRNLLEAYRERLIEAEKERLKMQSLAEKNESELRTQDSRREQLRMDEIGVLQFNRQAAS